jgi:hypothetical protein
MVARSSAEMPGPAEQDCEKASVAGDQHVLFMRQLDVHLLPGRP